MPAWLRSITHGSATCNRTAPTLTSIGAACLRGTVPLPAPPVRSAETSRSFSSTAAVESTTVCGAPLSRTLSANMNETPSPWKFSVEGETGFEDVYGHGDVRDDDGDRGGGEGAATAVHGDREAARAEGGRRL